MKKCWRYTSRILLVLLVLFIVLTASAWAYISTHKARLLKEATDEINFHISGQIQIGDISGSFFQTFPYLSLELFNVTIRDSLWKQHHHTLFAAQKVYGRLNPFRLLFGHFTVTKVLTEGASIDLFTDSTGYNNSSLFKTKKPDNKTSSVLELPELEVKNSKLIVEKTIPDKYFAFTIKNFVCKPEVDGNSWNLTSNIDVVVASLAFNKKNGPFLMNKPVTGKFKARFNPQSAVLQFDNIHLNIDRQDFELTGKFFLAEIPAPFTLSIKSTNLFFKKAADLLSSNIRIKLNQYSIDDPIDVECILDNTQPGNLTPLIKLKMKVRNNNIGTPSGTFNDASFDGYFTNELVAGQGHTDPNSIIRLTHFSAKWQNIPFRSDTILVKDLVMPTLYCDIHALFPLSNLNNLNDNQILQFNNGSGLVDLKYAGTLMDSGQSASLLNGNVQIDSANILYIPRNFSLCDGVGRIRFEDNNVYIDQLKARAGSSVLNMKADIKNLFSLLDKSPDKIKLNWHLSSPKINLQDFTVFLKKRDAAQAAGKKKMHLFKTIASINRVLDQGEVNLDIKANQLIYGKFNGSDLAASINFSGNEVVFKEMVIQEAAGSLKMNGSITNSNRVNSFNFHCSLDKVDISRTFANFSNFGQTAILAGNIKGNLDAVADMQGLLSERAEIIPNSLSGKFSFTLRNGALVQFEPVEKISEKVFKNRNFSDIRFADISNSMDIQGTAFHINRMEIRSTVLTLYVEGIYDMKKGTDMSIQIPLSNLKQGTADSLLVNQGIDSKTGVSARLRAKTGDDGKLKISWDPFKKALKEKKRKK